MRKIIYFKNEFGECSDIVVEESEVQATIERLKREAAETAEKFNKDPLRVRLGLPPLEEIVIGSVDDYPTEE